MNAHAQQCEDVADQQHISEVLNELIKRNSLRRERRIFQQNTHGTLPLSCVVVISITLHFCWIAKEN